MTEKQPNRLIIKSMIEAGDCTKDKIKEELGLSAASLATNFSYLRLMGFYPISDADGVLSFTDADGWAGMQAEKATKASTRSTSAKTPQERYVALVKRVARCETAEANADKRAEEDTDSEILDLRAQKAGIETKIAKFELNALLEAYQDDIDVSVTEITPDEPTDTEDADVEEDLYDEEEEDLV